MNDKILNLYIEVRQKYKKNDVSSDELEKKINDALKKQVIMTEDLLKIDDLLSCVEYVRVFSDVDHRIKINFSDENLKKHYYFYRAWENSPEVDSLDDENDEVPASLNWCLPNASLEGLWESLVLEEGIKKQLMSYVQTILEYSSRNVNPNIVHWNGVVLLHGPPGTGKFFTFDIFSLYFTFKIINLTFYLLIFQEKQHYVKV